MPGLWINAEFISMDNIDVDTSLLTFLRDHLHLVGTKEGCASGDCGACTVIVGNNENLTTVNSCITPVGSLQNNHIRTVEGVGSPDNLHPVQTCMIDHDASQCGFCTPGFVMSLVGLHERTRGQSNITDQQVIEAISGNLCRCTGYRPIIDAGKKALEIEANPVTQSFDEMVNDTPMADYHLPQTLTEVAEVRSRHKGATILAGGTDQWLRFSQDFERPDSIIDLSRIKNFRRIIENEMVSIGAGTSQADLYEFFQDRSPAVSSMLGRFGSPQIRARATIGGNIANGSPVADWPPVLMVLDANLHIQSTQLTERVLPISEFYHGYRKVDLHDEIITEISISQPNWSDLFVQKITKRFDDDISTLLGAFYIELDQSGRLDQLRIAFNGVAPTPIRMFTVEEEFQGEILDEKIIGQICDATLNLLDPITDIRASANYRMAMARATLHNALAKACQNYQEA